MASAAGGVARSRGAGRGRSSGLAGSDMGAL
jgi:hypothetical protein